MDVVYAIEPGLSVDEFKNVLSATTLAARRPVGDRDRLLAMLQNADIIATARVDGKIVGVARAVTDFSYCCYLSDLAVNREFQRLGIGRGLIDAVRKKAGPQTTLILVAAPGAEGYYPHIGMEAHPSCWIIPRSV